MDIRDVHLGRPLDWQDEASFGEANVIDEAALIGYDVSVRNVRFRTEGSGRVVLRGVLSHGRIEVREDGGKIEIDQSESASADERAPDEPRS
jgi:hypothetical protein